MKKKILVIGAGTIGLHSAFYLHQCGFEVEVLEALPENDESACSYGNCGMLVPSHFTPLASPAMLHSALKLIFDRKSPVYLPISKNISQLSWFFKFIQMANQKQLAKAIPLLYKLNEESCLLYRELSRISENKMAYSRSGMLMISTTQKGFEEETEVARIADKLGIETATLNNKSLKEHEPEIDFAVQGAILYKDDGQIDPVAHMNWLKTYLKTSGVVFHYNTTVTDFSISKGKITEVKTQHRIFKADEYVLATGAFSKKTALLAGIKLPIIPGKGYSIDFQKNELKLRTPLILTEAKVAITPFNDRIRVGSGMEFNGQVGKIRRERVQAMLDRTSEAIPSFKHKKAEKQNIWEGLRPVTPTGIPYIGRTQKINNILIAAGHAMMGVSLGPVTGKIISRLTDNKPSGFDDKLLMGG